MMCLLLGVLLTKHVVNNFGHQFVREYVQRNIYIFCNITQEIKLKKKISYHDKNYLHINNSLKSVFGCIIYVNNIYTLLFLPFENRGMKK